jgi:hypothetical protein
MFRHLNIRIDIATAALLTIISSLIYSAHGQAVKPNTHPFDFGDFLAIIIIIVLAFGGICACLGKYARMRAGQL